MSDIFEIDSFKVRFKRSRKDCKLIDCPGGPFLFHGTIGFKTEYYTSDPVKMEVFCLQSGEYFWGGTDNTEARAALIVTPLDIVEKKQ